MLDSVRNLKTSEIELSGPLPDPERSWLVGQLLTKRGVANAACDARGLVVVYDADVWRGNDLLDFLDDCGVPVAAIHAAGG